MMRKLFSLFFTLISSSFEAFLLQRSPKSSTCPLQALFIALQFTLILPNLSQKSCLDRDLWHLRYIWTLPLFVIWLLPCLGFCVLESFFDLMVTSVFDLVIKRLKRFFVMTLWKVFIIVFKRLRFSFSINFSPLVMNYLHYKFKALTLKFPCLDPFLYPYLDPFPYLYIHLGDFIFCFRWLISLSFTIVFLKFIKLGEIDQVIIFLKFYLILAFTFKLILFACFASCLSLTAGFIYFMKNIFSKQINSNLPQLSPPFPHSNCPIPNQFRVKSLYRRVSRNLLYWKHRAINPQL